jgi:hypothetical protein
VHIRPDWPLGSNAALLARQIRTSSGYTESRGAVLPAVKLAPVTAVPAPAQDQKKQLSAPTMSEELAGAVYAYLLDLARGNDVLPALYVIGRAVPGMSNNPSNVAAALSRLHSLGLIHQVVSAGGQTRAIRITATGAELRSKHFQGSRS